MALKTPGHQDLRFIFRFRLSSCLQARGFSIKTTHPSCPQTPRPKEQHESLQHCPQATIPKRYLTIIGSLNPRTPKKDGSAEPEGSGAGLFEAGSVGYMAEAGPAAPTQNSTLKPKRETLIRTLINNSKNATTFFGNPFQYHH